MTSAVSQITSRGRAVQAKNRPISVRDVLDDPGPRGLALREAAPGETIRSAYLHVPFCFHKCHYCDFYSIVDKPESEGGRQEAFTDRLIAELEAAAAARLLSPPLETIFVGGGTPTLLEPRLWRKLLGAMRRFAPLAAGGEFTVEANPETVTDELAELLSARGVNRVSIGCQSFNPRHLKTLERWHEPANVERSMERFRAAGIGNLNLDLIFAIPGQTLEEWAADLDAALALQPMHLSCYSLMYEPHTPLRAKLESGAIARVDEELEAEMYLAAIDRLAAAGYEQYEISNWARPSFRCRHNLVYWTNGNWWPFGPSASGHAGGVRWKNVGRLGDYLEFAGAAREGFPPITDVELLDEDGRVGERFMLGLRLIDGIADAQCETLLALGTRGDERRKAIARHVDAGLLSADGGRLRLTRSGLLLADAVLAELL